MSVPATSEGAGVAARLTELGLELPAVVPPVAAYVPAVRSGDLVFTSGQLPMVDGELPATGKVGAQVTPEQAKDLARTCALNGLAAIDALVGLDAVVQVVKVVGFVASTADFTGQPGVDQRRLRAARRRLPRRRRPARPVRRRRGRAAARRARRGGAGGGDRPVPRPDLRSHP